MLAVAALATVAAAAEQPWMNKADPPGTRAKALLGEMTLEEKLVMLHGDTNKTGGLPYVGNVPGNTRLKIPPLTLNDGPQVKCALLHAVSLPARAVSARRVFSVPRCRCLLPERARDARRVFFCSSVH